MENVPGLLSARLDGRSTLELIIKDLRHAGKSGYRLYSLTSGKELDGDMDFRQLIINARDYGVPQSRQRLFILGVRADIEAMPGILTPPADGVRVRCCQRSSCGAEPGFPWQRQS